MFLARIVMPRSRSSSLESRMQLADELALAELAALAQQAIDQRRLAVIDVGDDGDIADVGATGHGRERGAGVRGQVRRVACNALDRTRSGLSALAGHCGSR